MERTINVNLEETIFENDEILKQYISSLVLEYASIMNKIEAEICQKEEIGPQKDYFSEYKEKYIPIFNKYCSDKKRIYGGQATSYGTPTKFDGIENYIESRIEIKNKNRIEAYYKTNNGFDAEYLFIVFKKNNLCRIDNAKKRWYGKEEWRAIIL